MTANGSYWTDLVHSYIRSKLSTLMISNSAEFLQRLSMYRDLTLNGQIAGMGWESGSHM